jgi:hypothetical protein
MRECPPKHEEATMEDLWMVFDEAKIELIKHDPEAEAHNDLTQEEIREVKWAMVGKLTDNLASVTLRKPKGYRQL